MLLDGRFARTRGAEIFVCFWKVAELNALKPEDVDSLMKKMIDEVCSCEHLEMMSSSCRERYT